MLSRHERRCLDQIEEQLTGDDPDFARRMERTRWWWPWGRLTPRTTVAVGTLGLAVICMFLGEATGFITASMLGAAVLATRNWQLRADGLAD